MNKKSFNDFVSKLDALENTKKSLVEELNVLTGEFVDFEKDYKYEADIKTSKYKKDIKYYKDLAQKAKDGDIPTTDIDKKIEQLEEEKESFESKNEKLYKEKSSEFNKSKNELSEKIEKLDKEIQDQSDFIQIQKCAEVVFETTDYYEINGLKETMQMLEIKFFANELNGAANSIQINCGSFSLESTLKSYSERILRTYLPPKLEWLPDEWSNIGKENISEIKDGSYYDKKKIVKTISSKVDLKDGLPQVFFDNSIKKFFSFYKNKSVVEPFAIIELPEDYFRKHNPMRGFIREDDHIKDLCDAVKIHFKISESSKSTETKPVEFKNRLVSEYLERCHGQFVEFLVKQKPFYIEETYYKKDFKIPLHFKYELRYENKKGFYNDEKQKVFKQPQLVESVPVLELFEGNFCDNLKKPSVSEEWIREFSENGNIIDLDKEYSEGSLLEYLKGIVLENTVLKSDSPFNVADDARMISEEIFVRFEKNWNKFVKGPWLPEISGTLARLKFYCENKEKPRFYNNGLKNSYGFRLRTRDHSWINGTIYLLPENMEESSKNEIEVRTDPDGFKFKIGRMCVFLLEEERDHYKK